MDFAWASKENDKDYAIRESAYSVKIYRNFKPKGGDGSVNVGFTAEGLAGGVLLGVKGQGGIGFFDWESGKLVRRIEVEPRSVYWSESGELVCLACEDTFYVLRFSREQYVAALQAGSVEEDGVESAFEVVCDINESIRTGQWIGDCLVYTTSTNRLNYLVGDQTYTISHFDSPHYVLGYLARDARVYVCDRDVAVTSFALSVAVIEYQTLILRGDMEAAQGMLDGGEVPEAEMAKIARFLEGQGYKEEALAVATDKEHRFELALGLGRLEICLELARETDVEHRWKTVGDAALTNWDVALAEECFLHARDWGSLLLIYTSSASEQGLRNLASKAKESGQHNVAFSCLWQIADLEGCLGLLLDTGRTAEAVFFAQTYMPSRCRDVVGQWKTGLEKSGKGKIARALGVPPSADAEDGDEDMFPQWSEYLKLEKEGVGRQGALIDVGVNGGGEENGQAHETSKENGGEVDDADEDASEEVESEA